MATSKTILAIEDDTEVLRVYKTVLSQFGEFRVAANITQARPLLEGVDLIILDYYLRGETTPFLQLADELRHHAPVLVCSGVPSMAIKKAVQDLGLAGYWNKAAGVDNLIKRVGDILGTAAT